MARQSGDTSMMNDKLSRDVEKIKAVLSQTAHDVRGTAQDFMSDSLKSAKEKSSDIEKSVANFVVENPMKAVGYSVLAGMFCAWLLRKK